MTSHGAAILLAGAPFTNDGTVLLGAVSRPNVGPFQRSTGSGVPSAETRYQVIQVVNVHERSIGD